MDARAYSYMMIFGICALSFGYPLMAWIVPNLRRSNSVFWLAMKTAAPGVLLGFFVSLPGCMAAAALFRNFDWNYLHEFIFPLFWLSLWLISGLLFRDWILWMHLRGLNMPFPSGKRHQICQLLVFVSYVLFLLATLLPAMTPYMI